MGKLKIQGVELDSDRDIESVTITMNYSNQCKPKVEEVKEVTINSGIEKPGIRKPFEKTY